MNIIVITLKEEEREINKYNIMNNHNQDDVIDFEEDECVENVDILKSNK